MSAPASGVLYRAHVLEAEVVGSTQSAVLDIPAVAAGCRYGPVVSIVADLRAGEQVVVAALGVRRNDFIVIARWSPRWPVIDEISGLSEALQNSATSFDLDQLRERVERVDRARVQLFDVVRELERAHDRTTSRVDEVPDALAHLRVETDAKEAAGRSEARTEWRRSVYGADVERAAQCELRMTSDINNLAANTDYNIGGNFSVTRDTEAGTAHPMATLGDPTRVRIPYDGHYDFIMSMRSSATSGLFAGKVVMNADLSTTVNRQVVTSSVFSDIVGGTSTEGCLLRLRDTGQFSAGDMLTFSIWSSVAFNLIALYFGGVRSRIRVMRRVH